MFSSKFLRELNHTVVACTHTGVVCVVMGRGDPDKRGTQKVVFQ